MTFKISAELRYDVHRRSTLLLNVHAFPTYNQTLNNEVFTTTEGARCEFFPLLAGQNRYVRIDTGSVRDLLITYAVDAETNPDSRSIQNIDAVEVADLNQAALPFLFPSRYCESDRLGLMAQQLFGGIYHPLEQAAAISDWVFEIEYQSGLTNPSTSACDTLVQRAGVCRDFAHVAIAFCRALSIPARYFTGYACDMQPQDFHACFEVCVGNDWFIFDPTRLSSFNGLIRIASGRDAADTAFATIFGEATPVSQCVHCTRSDFRPLETADLQKKAVRLEP